MDDIRKKIRVHFGALVWASLICFCLVGFRLVYAGMSGYIFLVWNLFLAWLPLLFADAMELFHDKKNRIRLWIFGLLWLLFFPNAPYIVTDFTHLNPWATIGVPLWYDFALIAFFSVTGSLLGLCSLQTVKNITLKRFGAFRSWLFITAVSLLAGFGIYLGRYLRWNSWDVLVNPQELFSDIGTRIGQPLLHPQTWFISFLFGALILSSYVVFDHFCLYDRKKS